MNRRRAWGERAVLALSLVVALLLRTRSALHPFETSDNAELALRVMDHRGITWIFGERYGLLNPLAIKLFTALWSDAAGLALNEALFKLPVALVGTAQVLLVHRFALRLGASRPGALFAAGLTAVFPLHVMQSRYLWGYEVFGVFFLCLALWALFDFFERPSSRTALRGGLAVALYLISHGFIVPFFPFAAYLVWRQGIGRSLALARTHPTLWVVPLLYLPLTSAALQHTSDKKAQLGFYALQYAEPMLANLGWPLAAFVAAGVLVHLAGMGRSRYTMPLMVLAVLYFLPLLLGAKPGSTVTRGYMLVGSYAAVLSAVLAVDAALRSRRTGPRALVASLAVAILALTAWGTHESVFLRDDGVDFTAIRGERGGVPRDPGSKAAGLYVRRYVEHGRLLAVHPALEPPNALYYLGEGVTAFYDLDLEALDRELQRNAGAADVVIAHPALDPGPPFEPVARIEAEGVLVARIFARPGLSLPAVEWNVEEVNEEFDRVARVVAKF